MRASLVLTVIGPDRPGLVESIASVVAHHGGNWVESRMARLGGHFAGILLVDVAADRREALAVALRNLTGRDLQLVLVEHAEPGGGGGVPAGAASATLTFTLLGHDRPGVVRDVSRLLAQRGVNVVDLETDVTSAPMSGEPLFRARVEVSVPAGQDVGPLRQDLERAGESLGMDVSFEEAPVGGGER
jgi:glycine cleavage system regulatory protein